MWAMHLQSDLETDYLPAICYLSRYQCPHTCARNTDSALCCQLADCRNLHAYLQEQYSFSYQGYSERNFGITSLPCKQARYSYRLFLLNPADQTRTDTF